MIDKLNIAGLPVKYDYIFSEDRSLMGISYYGKKEEVIVPAECTEATVFKSLGKICIVYKRYDESTYTLTNRKKTLKLEGINDFVAGPSFLYVQITGETSGGLEWRVLNKDFESIKNLGAFTLNDIATKGGARIISATRTSLEVLDRHEKTCRITLKDSIIDEVITFGNKLKTPATEKEKSSTYNFEFNLSTGKVKMVGNQGDEMKINKFSNMGRVKSSIVNLMDSEFEESEIEVPVKRHFEKYSIATVKDVSREKAHKIGRLLHRFEECADFAIIALLIETYTTDGLIEKIDKEFVDVASITGEEVLNGKRQYAILCTNMKDILITLILERVSGKIIYDVCDKDNTNVWYISKHDVKVSDVQSQVERFPDNIDKDAMKLPLNISKNKDSYGNCIENERFENIVYVNSLLTFTTDDGNSVNTKFAFMIYDGFTYDIKKIKTRKKIEELSKQELHNRKYNVDDIILSTRTIKSTVLTYLSVMEPDEDELCE